MKLIFNIFVSLLPWKLKRTILVTFYGFSISKTAHIGFSYIFPKFLKMGNRAKIGHLNVAIHLEKIIMEDDAIICQKNWITGFPLTNREKYKEYPNRKPWLIMKKDSAITKQHIIDCTDTIILGEFSRIAGYHSQLLSHSTSIITNEGMCESITIGHHCFVGTQCILLPGTELPNQSVLGAGSVLTKKFSESFNLYAGNPARFVKKLNESNEVFICTFLPK